MTSVVVTYFSSPQSKKAVPVSLDEVLLDFKQGTYAEQISKVRKVLRYKGVEAYKEAKKLLPAIAFCGEFSGGHSKSNLVRYNNLLVFDIDHLSNNEMQIVGTKLTSENSVMAFWVSPSGNGYKGLIKVDYFNLPELNSLDDYYKLAFSNVAQHFKQKYDIQFDLACSDFSRICYVCWDEHLYYCKESVAFPIDCKELSCHEHKTISKIKTHNNEMSVSEKIFKPVNVKGKNDHYSRRIVSSIIRYLTKRKLSITYTYDEWLRVGFAIANTFNYDLGLKYYLKLCELDEGKYDKDKCIEKLQECYLKGTGRVSLGTIIEMARNKGYDTKAVLKIRGTNHE